MRRLSDRERLLAAAFGIILALLLLVQGIAIPLRAKLTEANSTLRQRQQVISRAQAAAADLYQIETDIKALSECRDSYTVTGEAVPQMMRQVEEAAAQAHVGQVDIRPLGKEEQSGSLRQRMQLELQAAFPTVKDFLYYLEEGQQPLIIERVDISSDRGDSDQVRATILLVAYSPLAGGKK